jgi:hypothetical protein
LGIFILFVFAQLDLGAEAIGALKVGKLLLDMAPLGACEFHDLLLFVHFGAILKNYPGMLIKCQVGIPLFSPASPTSAVIFLPPILAA